MLRGSYCTIVHPQNCEPLQHHILWFTNTQSLFHQLHPCIHMEHNNIHNINEWKCEGCFLKSGHRCTESRVYGISLEVCCSVYLYCKSKIEEYIDVCMYKHNAYIYACLFNINKMWKRKANNVTMKWETRECGGYPLCIFYIYKKALGSTVYIVLIMVHENNFRVFFEHG